jgi:putative ABC transport system permease protein
MFKNYLRTAINNLLGDKLYSGINIAGLAFGLAASILIALYVLDETSYDKHWENADRIYRVNTSAWSTRGSFSLGQGTSMPVLPALQNFFPQAIETGTRFMSADSEVTRGEQRFEEVVTRVDSGFLDMFELEQLVGSLADALTDPSKVALREDVAQRLSGTGESLAEVLGQVLTISYAGVSRDYQVAAI